MRLSNKRERGQMKKGVNRILVKRQYKVKGEEQMQIRKERKTEKKINIEIQTMLQNRKEKETEKTKNQTTKT